jgi:adenine-specific DNA-methyltransferase
VNVQSVYKTVELNTREYENRTSIEDRKKNSQYFTPYLIGKYMTDIITNIAFKKTIHVLEPSGGTGKLIISFLLTIIDLNIERVVVDIFEIDCGLIPILNDGLSLVKKMYDQKEKQLIINVKCKNFLTVDINKKYDIIIGNPPYKKIRKDAVESIKNVELVYGQPNVYGLFIGRGMNLLKENGQLVYLVPRSIFNGKYFGKLREILYEGYSLSFIHSFESRSKVINDEILQEIVIIKIEKRTIDNISINHSLGIEDIDMKLCFEVDKSIIWDKYSSKIRLPINSKDVALIQKMNSLKYRLSDLEWRFKTGPVVDFRLKEYISYEQGAGDYLPLIWCVNFGNSRISWPILKTKFPQYIAVDAPNSNLLMRGDYLLVKRFSSKEEDKCLKPNIISSSSLNFAKFGIENHINYLRVEEQDKKYIKGLFILLNSSYYNQYFTIINGTTQINVSDLNELPMLEKKHIENIGKTTLDIEDLGSLKCDEILYSFFGE